MNILERKIENQMQFWSLLGPFIILLSLTILLFKVSSHWYLPVCVLMGIPLCMKWRMRGLVVAIAVLLAIMVIFYSRWEMEERYWHIGMGLAMAFSLAVLTLALEEFGSLINQLQRESQGRLDNFLYLNEKMKAAEQEWSVEKGVLQSQIQALTLDYTQTQEDKQFLQKLTQLAKEELITLRTQYERLLEDLAQKKQQIAQLKERTEETEATLQELINGETEQLLQKWTASLVANHQVELDQLKAQQNSIENQLQQITQEKELITIDLEQVQRDLEACHQQIMKDAEDLNQAHMRERQYIGIEQEKRLIIQDLEQTRAREHQLQQSYIQQELILSQHLEANHCLQVELAEKEACMQQVKSEYDHICQQLEQVRQDIEVYRKQAEELSQLQIKEELMQSALKSSQKEVRLPYAPGNTRKIEVMYLQLQEQFQEKSLVLAATRRQLFYTQEQVLSLQREKEEEQYVESREEEILLQKELNRLIKEFESIQIRDREELEMLYSLVGDLFNKT